MLRGRSKCIWGRVSLPAHATEDAGSDAQPRIQSYPGRTQLHAAVSTHALLRTIDGRLHELL